VAGRGEGAGGPEAVVDGASLAAFRVAFGLLMVYQAARLLPRVDVDYHRPALHFAFFGLEDVVFVWPGVGVWPLLAAVALGGVGIALGLFFRAACALFGLAFGYLFLIDAAYHNNHYYLLLLLALLLGGSGAHHAWSLDRRRGRVDPAWAGRVRRRDLWLLRAQLVLVYAFAAVAKLNPDWLGAAEPLASWLAHRAETARWPGLVGHPAVPWIMAWGGLAFDAVIGPALLWRRTRPAACVAAALFHVTNAALFSIGVFPWLMLATLLLFAEPDLPRRLLRRAGEVLAEPWLGRLAAGEPDPPPPPRPRARTAARAAIALYLTAQVLLPLRHWAYPGDVAWNEAGHRFAWRMKLRSKQIHTLRVTVHYADGRAETVDPVAAGHLNRRQARDMAAHPGMLRQYARFLRRRLTRPGAAPPEVRVLARGSLNFCDHDHVLVDPTADLGAPVGCSLAPDPVVEALDPPHEWR